MVWGVICRSNLEELVAACKDSPLAVSYTHLTKGHVEFRNATFSYPGAEKPVLHDISFEAKPGEVTAIIGGTGSGKSTLVNLILRFYDVETGSKMCIRDRPISYATDSGRLLAVRK